MASQSFSPSFAFMQKAEGGYSDDPADPGNWFEGQLVGSNMGVTAATLAVFTRSSTVTADEMRTLSIDAMQHIYRSNYWQPCGADDLAAGLDLMHVDFAYNAGVDTAHHRYAEIAGLDAAGLAALTTPARIRVLQSRLGVTRDGIAGRQTLGAVALQGAQTALAILAYASVQERFYRALRDFPYYGTGWLNRVSARCSLALQLTDGVRKAV